MHHNNNNNSNNNKLCFITHSLEVRISLDGVDLGWLRRHLLLEQQMQIAGYFELLYGARAVNLALRGTGRRVKCGGGGGSLLALATHSEPTILGVREESIIIILTDATT
jgi:hypothetical protein